MVFMQQISPAPQHSLPQHVSPPPQVDVQGRATHCPPLQ
jgi:hypothetical protein